MFIFSLTPIYVNAPKTYVNFFLQDLINALILKPTYKIK